MLSTARKSPPRCEYLCVPPLDRGEGHCNDKDDDGNDKDDKDDEDDEDDEDEDDEDDEDEDDEDDEDILWTAVMSNGTSRATIPALGWH